MLDQIRFIEGQGLTKVEAQNIVDTIVRQTSRNLRPLAAAMVSKTLNGQGSLSSALSSLAHIQAISGPKLSVTLRFHDNVADTLAKVIECAVQDALLEVKMVVVEDESKQQHEAEKMPELKEHQIFQDARSKRLAMLEHGDAEDIRMARQAEDDAYKQWQAAWSKQRESQQS